MIAYQVLESWRLVLGNGGYDSIRLEDVRIFVRDDVVRLAQSCNRSVASLRNSEQKVTALL